MKSDLNEVTNYPLRGRKEENSGFLNHDDFHRLVNIDLIFKFLPKYTIPELVNIGLDPFLTLPSSGKIDRQNLIAMYRQQQEMKSRISVDWFSNFKDLDVPIGTKLRALIEVINESGVNESGINDG